MGAEPDDPDIGLEDAYAVETPDDNRRLYAAWAATYEASFATAERYVYHRRVAEIFTSGTWDPAGAVLDVGCGTGLVGVELRRLGAPTIDGIDISAEMLAEAGAKYDAAGAVYRSLIEADLTAPVPLASDTYAGVVSAGAFTHGHLGVSAIDEVLRVSAPGGRGALGVNASHFRELGFDEYFERAVGTGTITDFALVDVAVYDDPNRRGADDEARVAVFTVG